ncbi:MAG: sulfotransferase domain-containing protein [Pseudomonadota bacterium]
MKSLFWLASYPKSGNTWMRAFLANYIFDQPEPVPVNELHRLGTGDANAEAFIKVVGNRFDPMNPADSARIREPFFKVLVANGADVNLVKTHNQNSAAFGVDLIPVHYTRGAIYIIRDPRDMIISYASHLGMTVEQAIKGMNSLDNATNADAKNVHQYLGRWSDHVTSWTRTKKFPVAVVRYEDMLQRPEKSFSTVIRRLGMPIDKARLSKAIEFSSFKKLRSQEEETGFVENSEKQERFFRKGTSGQWRDELTSDEVAQIEADHGKIMRRHGYLS